MPKERDDNLKPFEFGSSHPATFTSTKRSQRGWLIGAVVVLSLCAAGSYLWIFDRPRVERWLRDTPLAPPPTVTTIYKWQDVNGNWNLTDTPPAAGVTYETLHMRSDTNVMPLVPRDE